MKRTTGERAASSPTSLLVKVRTRAAIPAHRKAAGLVEGEYGSIHAGRSLDFDDLREYVIGDDIRDIDWKATARSGRPLIKRFVATRQHSVLLVVDTGRSMAALADADATKRQVAVTAAAIVGQMAMRHGDVVGLVAGPVPPRSAAAGARSAAVRNPERVRYLPPGTGDLHLERMLRVIDESIDVDGPRGDVAGLLTFVSRRVRRRTIVVLVIDDIELTAEHENILRRLMAQHEILCCTVSDLALTDPSVAERSLRVVGPTTGVAPFFSTQTALRVDLAERAARRERATRSTLARLGITSCRLEHDEAVLSSLVTMLGRHKHARPSRGRR